MPVTPPASRNAFSILRAQAARKDTLTTHLTTRVTGVKESKFRDLMAGVSSCGGRGVEAA